MVGDLMALADKLLEVKRAWMRVKASPSPVNDGRMEHALAALPDPEDFEGSKVLAHAQKLAFKLADVKQERDELAAALLSLWNVLGPEIPSDTGCDGARMEWGEALGILRAALKREADA